VRTKASIEEQAIKALLKRKREYEKYFKSREGKAAEDNGFPAKNDIGMDNQAQNAYTNIIKTLVDLAKKVSIQTNDTDEMKRLAEEILENDYGIKRKLRTLSNG
jgi:hypothetical protein